MSPSPEQLLRSGERQAAAAAAERALAKGDELAARRVLAWLALQAGDAPRAQEHIEAGLAVAGGDADLRFMAGCLDELTALAAPTAVERDEALGRAEEHLRRAVEGETSLVPLGVRLASG